MVSKVAKYLTKYYKLGDFNFNFRWHEHARGGHVWNCPASYSYSPAFGLQSLVTHSFLLYIDIHVLILIILRKLDISSQIENFISWNVHASKSNFGFTFYCCISFITIAKFLRPCNVTNKNFDILNLVSLQVWSKQIDP